MKKPANLLVIGNMYRHFIKDTIEVYYNHFPKINVFVKYNPVGELSNLIPMDCSLKDYLKTNSKQHLLSLNDKPDNVEVNIIPLYYLPTDAGFKKLGEKLFVSIDRHIAANKIKSGLIHAHFVWPAGYAAARLKEKYNIPCVITAHGYDIYDLPFRDGVWRSKIKYALDTADYIITVSNKNLNCINRLDVKTPARVIPNGFSRKLFFPQDSTECRQRLNLPANRKILLTAGNLVEIKGHKFLIEAMGEVAKNDDNVFCVIVGGGILRDSLEKQIKQLGLSGRVLIAGFRPHEEIPLWMNACDIFVLPSLNEGNPTVLFECLSCGKPFVGTNVGGIPEIITSDHYGLLCDPGDPAQLARQILAALNRQWDHRSIENYAQQYTWEYLSLEHIKIYQEVLGG